MMSRTFGVVLLVLLFCVLGVAQAVVISSSLVGLGMDGSIWYSTDETTWVNIPGALASLALGDLNGDKSFDIAGRNSVGKVYYTTNRTSWTPTTGTLAQIAVGDLNGDGSDDITGLTSLGKVYYTTDKGAHWTNIPGTLAYMTVGDIDGDLSDDLVGLTSAGKIYHTTNKTSWTPMSGTLSKIVVGDFNGDASDDIAGLTSLGKIYYTVDKGVHWWNIPGALAVIESGDLDGDGDDDLVGLTSAGKIYYTTNKTTWVGVPGTLAKIATGDLDDDGMDDIAGLTSQGKIYYTTDKGAHWVNVPGTLSQLYCSPNMRYRYPGEMVYIPAGSFQMGNNGSEPDSRDRELPQHWVYLSGYWIGKYEVTRGEYRQFIDAGGYSNPEYWSSDGWSWKVSESRTEPDFWDATQNWGTPPGSFNQTDSHPVVGVTYYEAEAFCKWAGGHLPTEGQWEKAARWTGSYPNAYPWGNTWDAEKCNNSSDTVYSGYQTAPVGSYPAGVSPYGCHDMAGNVWEWAQDWYSGTYYSETPSGGWVDPPGPSTGSDRVLRGGGWGSGGYYGRCADRNYSNPYYYWYYGGFRFAR